MTPPLPPLLGNINPAYVAAGLTVAALISIALVQDEEDRKRKLKKLLEKKNSACVMLRIPSK